MKTKKRSSSSSARFARGKKASVKRSSVKRGARKSTSRRSAPSSRKGGFIQKLEDLTPL